jgi:hypothetical protein
VDAGARYDGTAASAADELRLIHAAAAEKPA